MRPIYKRALSVILCVLLLCSTATVASFAGVPDILSFAASAETDSGMCGDNVYWSFDASTGALSITGIGNMLDTGSASVWPWRSFRSSIKTVTISNGVTSIGSYAFFACENMTSISIGSSVTQIGSGVFYNCSSLVNVVLPKNLMSLASQAFYGCENMTGITIPESVVFIGRNVFGETPIYYNSDNWINGYLYYDRCLLQAPKSTSAVYSIPDGTRCIAAEAFYNSFTLTSITIPDSVIGIGSSAFSGCSALANVYYTGTLAQWLEISFQSGGSTPVCRHANLFIHGQQITDSISIPSSITSIGAYAFYGLNGLINVTIPEGVTSIGDGAFGGCAITGISIPDSVTNIGAHAFKGCTELVSTRIPNGVENIGDSTFKYCTSLESIIIGNRVSSIGDSAFDGCESLTDVAFSDGITSIGSYAFRDCKKLRSVIIPDSVQHVYESAFLNCEGLTRVKIGNRLTELNDYVFCNCSSLTNVVIGANVTDIGASAFKDCTSLTSIHIPSGVTCIGIDAFYGCSNLAFICADTEDCYAAQYARSRKIEFCVCEGHPCIAGDASCDGQVDQTDVARIARYIAGGWGVAVDVTAADVNRDGSVDLKDVVVLRRYLTGGWGIQLV